MAEAGRPSSDLAGREKTTAGTKEQIRRAAESLFHEKGYEGTSVRDICHHAGVGASAVSYYFGSKEHLYRQLFPEGGELEEAGKKERIEEEAIRLFAAEGYERVSIRDIGRAAGVNSAAISYYFGGKQKLYQAILSRGTEILAHFVGQMEEEQLPPSEVVRRYGLFICAVGREHSLLLRILFWEMMHPTDVFASDFIKERMARFNDVMRHAVIKGMEEGDFRPDLDPDEVCLSWSAMIVFFFLDSRMRERMELGRGISLESYMEQSYRIMMEGIAEGGLRKSQQGN